MEDQNQSNFEIQKIKKTSDEFKIKSTIIEFLKFAIVAMLIVLPIRFFVAQPFIVSGDSMFPTFVDGEYLIVDELSYNLGNIHRGDVVIFRYPRDPKKFFIKRIIGLPNETIILDGEGIEIKNKNYPNGLKIDEPYIDTTFTGKNVYITKDNEYFVMGDNRDQSSDSRFWGPVEERFLVGRAYLRLFPIAHASYLPGSLKKYE